MKFSMQQTKYVRSTDRKVVVALVLASLLNGLSIPSAFADRNDNHGRGGDQHGGDHGPRGHHEGHGRWDEHQRYYNYDQRVYEQPVYVPPPPVYYEPPQRSGINFYFPFD